MDLLSNEYIKILIIIIIGFVIGLQRELSNFYKNRTDLAGARTFSIVALIGYLSTYINSNLIYVLGLIIAIGYYLNNINDNSHRGITTEVSLIATYILGILINKNLELTIYIAVLIVFLLNLKS
ncbi:MAG: MgtC/SapB family protein, partial [Nautilia sp.]